mmetsp:Transcript_1594/g.2634  ORF Transcript_1594/g.2634 Transcript_1594/m.2634 type:complete len:205 (-) Transcript_1594:141-755(-)
MDWISPESNYQVMEVNYFAVVKVIQAFLPLLKQVRHSRIINISSIAGICGSYQLGIYTASKHAVEGMGKVLRQELRPWNIHTCHINPGFMKTPFIQSSFDASIASMKKAPRDILDQYEISSSVNTMRQMIDLMAEDPRKVVAAIVDNVTIYRPDFNVPVGTGIRLSMLLLAVSPQCLIDTGYWLLNLAQICRPKPEVLRRIQVK